MSDNAPRKEYPFLGECTKEDLEYVTILFKEFEDATKRLVEALEQQLNRKQNGWKKNPNDSGVGTHFISYISSQYRLGDTIPLEIINMIQYVGEYMDIMYQDPKGRGFVLQSEGQTEDGRNIVRTFVVSNKDGVYKRVPTSFRVYKAKVLADKLLQQ